MADIVQLKDSNGDAIYPVTTGEAITVTGGKTLDNAFKDKSDALDATIATLSTVATSGKYDDLTGKPTLFSGSYDDLTNKPTLFSKKYDDLTDKPTLFSGDYNDLTNKPTIPTVLIKTFTEKSISVNDCSRETIPDMSVGELRFLMLVYVGQNQEDRYGEVYLPASGRYLVFGTDYPPAIKNAGSNIYYEHQKSASYLILRLS